MPFKYVSDNLTYAHEMLPSFPLCAIVGTNRPDRTRTLFPVLSEVELHAHAHASENTDVKKHECFRVYLYLNWFMSVSFRCILT